MRKWSTRPLKIYFIRTGFHDLLPLAIEIAREQKYGRDEITEAICKVFDKYREYPPTRNRTAWFATVYREKLREARADSCKQAQETIRKFLFLYDLGDVFVSQQLTNT